MLASPNAHHHQIAYVTNDMDKALEVFARDYGVSHFFTLADGEHESPAMPGARLKISLANVNGTEIELIQPLAGPLGIYSDVLPKDGHFVMVPHHVCIRIGGGMENWDRHRASIDEKVHPIVLEGALGDMLRFVYTDERDRLGHYLEHVWMSQAVLDQMAQNIPSHPA